MNNTKQVAGIRKVNPNCPQPVFVTRNNSVTITGKTERNQRYVMKLTKLDPTTKKPIEEVQTINLPNQNLNCQQTQPYNQKARGDIIIKFKDQCDFSYTYTFQDNGESPLGVPQNWYVFSFVPIDLSGNYSPTTNDYGKGSDYGLNLINNEQIINNNEDNSTTIINPNRLYSKSITVYHDIDNPDNSTTDKVKSPSYDPIIDFGNFGFTPITKDTTITTTTSGERQADLQIQLINDNEQIINSSGTTNPPEPTTNLTDQTPYTTIQRNSPNGTAETNLNLGTPIRDDNGVNGDQTTGDCIQMGGILLGSQTLKDQNGKILYPNGQQVSPTRRIGTCQDGIYTLKTRHIDTAGNIGEWTSKQIERDTVSPLKPKVELSKTGDILGEFLSVKISGEATAKASIEITNNSSYQTAPKQLNINLDINGNFNASNTIGQLTCGNITYTVKTTLTDRAGNISETTTQTIQTAECPTCGSTGNGSFILPIKTTQFQISGEFPRYQITSGLPHAGIDFAANSDTPVLAAQAGTIKRAIFSYTDNYGKEDPFNVTSGWANTVIIEHNLPNQPTIQTIYGHLAPNNISNLKEGDTVQQGQVIGLLGSTGSSSGFHLHFQVEVQGSTLNPIHEGKYNKYPPQNPRIFLGEIENNLTESQSKIYCNFDGIGNVVGTEEYPWGGKDAESLGEFRIEIRKNKDGNIEKKLSPSPQISYVDTKSKFASNEAIVYGLGVFKNSEAKVFVNEEKEVCQTQFFFFKDCKYEWKEVANFNEKIEHSEIELYKENASRLDQIWNDDPPFEKGKWKSNDIKLGVNINYDDKICTKSKVYGFTESGSNWWNNLDYGNIEAWGNCRVLLNYENPDYNKIIERVKELTNQGKTNTQEYRDLVESLANATSVADIINKSTYINSAGQVVQITPQMWADWINNPNTRIDPNTKFLVKNAKAIGTISLALNLLSIALAVTKDIESNYANTNEGLINPAPATTATLLSIGASYATGVIIIAACTLTGGACVIVAVIGSVVVGVATQIGADYFFTKVLTKDNVQKVVDYFIATIPNTKKEEIDWILGLCYAVGGGLSCGTNPYNY